MKHRRVNAALIKLTVKCSLSSWRVGQGLIAFLRLVILLLQKVWCVQAIKKLLLHAYHFFFFTCQAMIIISTSLYLSIILTVCHYSSLVHLLSNLARTTNFQAQFLLRNSASAYNSASLIFVEIYEVVWSCGCTTYKTNNVCILKRSNCCEETNSQFFALASSLICFLALIVLKLSALFLRRSECPILSLAQSAHRS